MLRHGYKHVFLSLTAFFSSCGAQNSNQVISAQAATALNDSIDENDLKVQTEEINLNGNKIGIYTAEIPPTKFSFKLVRSQWNIDASDKVSQIAKRNQAILAVNGGFFSIYDQNGMKLSGDKLNACYPNDSNPYHALPSRVLKISNKWYGTHSDLNSAVGWSKDGKRFVVGKISAAPIIEWQDRKLIINELNKYVVQENSIVYTSVWKKKIPLNKGGIAVVVSKNKVIKIKKLMNKKKEMIFIPKNGFIIYLKDVSFYKSFVLGNEVKLNFQIQSENAANLTEWNSVDYILSGVPFLIKNGEINLDYPDSSFYLTSHARTAVCKLKNENILFLVSTGADEVSDSHSGLSIPQLAKLMLEKGCMDAVNIDGGHSSVFYYKGKILNRDFPKNEEDCSRLHERSVSDAIIVQ